MVLLDQVTDGTQETKERKKIQNGTRASNLSTQKKDGAIHKNMQIEGGWEDDGLP